MRYLLDSNSATFYVNNQYEVHERVRFEASQGNPVGICIPVLAELLSGIEHSHSRDKNMKLLHLAMKNLRLWPFDEDAANIYGRIHADLERRGRPIGPIDVMVAAVAFSMSPCTVVTTDQDFHAIPGLRIENWRD